MPPPCPCPCAESPKGPLGEGGGGGKGGGGFDETVKRGLAQFAPVLAIVLLAASMLGGGGGSAQEVSFQWFKTALLAQGAVERLEVANKQQVKVYLRPGAAAPQPGRGMASSSSAPSPGDADMGAGEMEGMSGRGGGAGLGGGAAGKEGVPRYVFNIGSVDAFERAMEDAQDALGMDPSK